MNTEYYWVCLILLTSAYFWGKIINKFFEDLKKINTTVFGMLIIFGLFQILVFIGIPRGLDTETYRIALLVFLAAGPVLCLILWVNVLPNWNDLGAFLLGCAVTAAIVCASSLFNTNNSFFDSTFYLSKVIESSTASKFGYLNNYNGDSYIQIQNLYDYQGYYYFWGTILRQYRLYSGVKESLTPMYIWCATMTYGMCLGNLIASSIQVFFEKINWKNALCMTAIVLYLMPYYTNYFNTTLGFFGNTIRTVATGALMLLAYFIVKNKHGTLMLLYCFCSLAAISFSSSSFFLTVFISASVFLCLICSKDQEGKLYPWFIFGNIPSIWYFYIIESGWEMNRPQIAKAVILAYACVFIFSICIRWIPERVNKWFRIAIGCIYGLILCGMLYYSYLNRNAEMGYSFFFQNRSTDDMTLNYSNWTDVYELIRNCILWVFLLVGMLRFQRDKSYKLLLLISIVLFINPLVCPFIAKFATDVVYCRVFEIIVNPFVLVFLAADYIRDDNWIQWITVSSLVIASVYSGLYAYKNAITPFSTLLVKNDDGYNWKLKVTDDEWDIYNYFMNNILPEEGGERPVVLSQDISIKAYLPNIQLCFSSIDIRTTLRDEANLDLSTDKGKAILYFFPFLSNRTEYSLYGHTADYTKVGDVIRNSGAEYVVMRTSLVSWDVKGYYIKSYEYALRDNCEKVYQNDTWILMKVVK